MLEGVRRRLGQAEQDLRDFDNTSGVSVIAVPTPQAGNAPKKLRDAYVMPASCRIAYRLDARPEAGELALAPGAILQPHSCLLSPSARGDH